LKREKRKEWIAILDFGSQYSQLIARRIREAKVYSEILPYGIDLEKSDRIHLKGLFSPEVRQAYMKTKHQCVIKKYLN